MHDSTVKQLSDHLTPSPSSSHNVTHLLAAADSHHIDNRHLTIAKYLPLNTFKNTATLREALDNIHCEINMQKRMGSAPHLRKTSINSMKVNLAKNIAITTTDLNIDYASKLDLINTASSHRVFKTRNIFKFGGSLLLKAIMHVTKYFRKASNTPYNGYRTDAQKILDEAKLKIQTCRDKIILC